MHPISPNTSISLSFRICYPNTPKSPNTSTPLPISNPLPNTQKNKHHPKNHILLMWSLYYLIQQKSVRYCSPFSRIVWKMTYGDRNYLKQQKSVEFLLFWLQFSSSGHIAVLESAVWSCRTAQVCQGHGFDIERDNARIQTSKYQHIGVHVRTSTNGWVKKFGACEVYCCPG